MSLGKVVGSNLECAYHGWQFEEHGKCKVIPGLSKDLEERSYQVPTFPVIEQQGYVWIWPESLNQPPQPMDKPFTFPLFEDSHYTSIRFKYEVKASLESTLENMLDVPHTAFLHKGLFRGGKKNKVKVLIRSISRGIEVQYQGEPRPTGIAGKLLAPKGGDIAHYDRFLLPSISQVEYKGGENHFLVTSALTPVKKDVTKFYSMISFRLFLPGILIRLFVTPIAKKILAQDAWILKKQTENLSRFEGEKYVSTEVDVFGPRIRALMKRMEQKSLSQESQADHKEDQIQILI